MGALSSLSPDRRLVKALCVGYPGTGKTGALAALANAGYRLRIMNFDGGTARAPLLEYVEPQFYPNVEIADIADTIKIMDDGTVSTVGQPSAYRTAARLGMNWKYGKEEDGSLVDLGPIKSWGAEDVLVLDNLTKFCDAAGNMVRFQNNRVGKPLRKQDWGAARELVDGFLGILAGDNVPCHVLVLAHIIMTGPRETEADEDERTKTVREQQTALVPWRLMPKGMTANHSSEVHRHFPYLFHFEKSDGGPNKTRRMINPFSVQLDTKMPLKSITKPLPIETGLPTIFAAARREVTQEAAA